MYVNPHFAERELPALQDTIEQVRFGALVLCADALLAAHVPFVLHREQGSLGTLAAHVARNDPLARHLRGRPESLVIFGGARAYVSPRWYPNGGLPTYNYIAVHAYGRPRVIEERDGARAHLAELTAVHERRYQRSWTLADADQGLVEDLLAHIVAFTIEIESIQGKRKLSQNRAAGDREGVIRGLRERACSDDAAPDELVIAEAMSAYRYASDEAQSLIAPPRG
jgi:transcriptional regulator